MFETELKEIQNKLTKTLNEYRKIKKLEKRMHDLYWIDKSIYGLQVNHIGKNSLYERATSDIRYLLEKNGLRNIGAYTAYNKKEFKNKIKEVENLKNEDVLKQLSEYINSKSMYSIKPEIAGDTITIGLSDYNLYLLLNSLNILINGEIENTETLEKARNALKECNTFIYRNIKITVYKNGKTKLVFADKKILEKFKNLVVL